MVHTVQPIRIGFRDWKGGSGKPVRGRWWRKWPEWWKRSSS